MKQIVSLTEQLVIRDKVNVKIENMFCNLYIMGADIYIKFLLF